MSKDYWTVSIIWHRNSKAKTLKQISQSLLHHLTSQLRNLNLETDFSAKILQLLLGSRTLERVIFQVWWSKKICTCFKVNYFHPSKGVSVRYTTHLNCKLANYGDGEAPGGPTMIGPSSPNLLPRAHLVRWSLSGQGLIRWQWWSSSSHLTRWWSSSSHLIRHIISTWSNHVTMMITIFSPDDVVIIISTPYY